MGQLLRYPSPHQERDRTAALGMGLFLAGWAMTFGGMFVIYAGLRARASSWPPPGLPLLLLDLPSASSLLTVFSSVAFERGLHWVRHRAARRAGHWLYGCVGLGVVFLGVQASLLQHAVAHGLTVERGGYAAVFYAFTGLHALHLVIGVVAVLVLAELTRRGRYSPARHLPLRLWSLYWHFVGVVWLAIYTLLFLL